MQFHHYLFKIFLKRTKLFTIATFWQKHFREQDCEISAELLRSNSYRQYINDNFIYCRTILKFGDFNLLWRVGMNDDTDVCDGARA
jgi:hypothetical protein